MKKQKQNLSQDTVESNTLHVGIELECITPAVMDHDDYDCQSNGRANYRQELEDMSCSSILRDYFNLDNADSTSLAPYFRRQTWAQHQADEYTHECDGDCDYQHADHETTREQMQEELHELTNNPSIFVEGDGSLRPSHDETDTEVVWNYYAAKETIKDNALILNYLKRKGSRVTVDCGLHVNLNDYLKDNRPMNIRALPKAQFDFLWAFVEDHRKNSSYCNREFLSFSEKYCMIFAQTDRWEFRFFGATFDAELLNQYVTLANVIYRRLHGLNAQLSKSAIQFWIRRMKVLKRSSEVIADAIAKVNTLQSLKQIEENRRRYADGYTRTWYATADSYEVVAPTSNYAWPVYDGNAPMQYLLQTKNIGVELNANN